MTFPAVPSEASREKEQSALIEHLRVLASDSLEGRGAGTRGGHAASVYIKEQFEKLGLSPAGEDGSFFQEFPIPGEERVTGRNVVAILPGNDPVLKDEFLVIGAHFDHLGKKPGEGGGVEVIYNGADDNASGVAGLLELARTLRGARFYWREEYNVEFPPPLNDSGPRRSILFASFDAEEIGALGSLYFTKEPPVPLSKIIAMVNLDMIGRLNDRTLIVSGYDTSPDWDGLLDKANEGMGLDLKKSPGGFGGSDHTSFYKDNIPVLFFFTGAHDDYNTPNDDWERINVEGEVLVLDYVKRIVMEICERDARPLFSRSQAPAPGRGRTSLPVYVGTVPDFSYAGTGFAIIGAKEGSPAEKAGLVKGDVIVGIDGNEVKNIYDYMEFLKGKKPGDKAVFTVLRGGKKLSLEVTLAGKE